MPLFVRMTGECIPGAAGHARDPETPIEPGLRNPRVTGFIPLRPTPAPRPPSAFSGPGMTEARRFGVMQTALRMI